MPIYCPSDTCNLVNRNNISNFALRYQYFLESEHDRGKVKFLLNASQLGGSQGAIGPLIDRQTNQLNYLAGDYQVFCGFYEVDWRLVVGLGSEHVQETNMMFDHVYGIPYLPGSAFKGVVRSWVIQEDFGNDERLAMRDIGHGDPADLREKKSNFFAVLGSQKSVGKVKFLSAYPTDNVTLSVDIMNPHFPGYYTGSQLPTDTQNPIPINFLTLQQTPFRFVLLSKKQELIDLAADWTDKALKNKGLGAKTASGYGYFRSQYNVPRNLRPDANFQVPTRIRPQQLPQISLDEAFQQFNNSGGAELNPQLIDTTSLKNRASQLAQVATRDDFIELSQLEGIHPTLIETAENEATVSDFGVWIWESLKTELLSSRILELPRLIYAIDFRQKLKNLPPDELVDVQEELIVISNQLEMSNGEVQSIAIAKHFRYTSDTNQGTFTFWEYIN
ncbi:MAG: type III-B CRISPR module RAMP protein Cmr6 [Candidatus Poribacteria bacterium]|nr:type III-B CRISPR module RAMP protein Cmr6 [Candidatus Poribacteria bacterium]